MNTSDNKPGYPSSFDSHLKYNFKEDFVFAQCEEWDRENIRKIILENNAKTFLEIGIYGGATLLSLYDLAKENGIKIYGIDPHDKIEIYNGKSKEEVSDDIKHKAKNLFEDIRINLENIIKKYNLNDQITYLNDVSQNVVNKFENDSIDVLHIDGDHSTEGVYNDLLLYYPKVRMGGVIICDDADWPSVFVGIHKFCSDNNIKYSRHNTRKIIINK